MKWVYVMKKSAVEMVRDVRSLALVTVLPSVFMVIFGLAFGGGLPTYTLFLEQQDEGYTPPGGQKVNAGAALAARIADYRYGDGQEPGKRGDQLMFTIKEPPKNGRERDDALMLGTAALHVVIPNGFTQAVLTGTVTDAAKIILRGDPAKAAFGGVHWALTDMFREETARVRNERAIEYSKKVFIGAVESKGTTEFDYTVPGVIVFAVLLLIAQTALLIVTEIQAGTLERMRLSAMTATDLFVGVAASQMIFAAVQVVLMFGVALLMGFNAPPGSLGPSIVVAIILSLAAVGFGLVVSCVARNPMEAANVGAGFLVPLTFLSGAFFPIPERPLWTIFGREVGILNFSPAKQACLALSQMLTNGVPASEVGFEMVSALVLSVGVLVIGIIVFQRFRMRTER